MPDRVFFRNEFFRVVSCDQCGLGFVNPRPTFAEMARHYPPEYFEAVENSSHDRYLERRFRNEAAYLRPLEARRASPLLLDIGCANGDFPRYMVARGWRVEGVEVSQASRRIHDFKVYPQEFQDIPVNQPTYDAVTAWAVLEHTHDPMTYFRKAAQVLKPGGLFVFLVTNFESIGSRRLFCEDVPRHLYFFTRSTVRRYLETTGFTLLREDNNRNIYKLAPLNWLAYQIQTRIHRRPFAWRDVPLTKREFLRDHGLQRGFRSSLRYAAYSPASVFGRLLLPFLETAEIMRKSYGISTYVARK
jgi:SAM-dependent methyltransferase